MGTNEKNMTTGSPGKLIITFAIPLMLGNIFQQFYTMADTMIVGQVVGVEALAAVGAGDWLVWLVFGIMTGITQGFSILVAQFYGAREKENLKCAVAKSYIMTALLSVIVLAVSEGAVYHVLLFLQTPDNVIDLTMLYLRLIFAGIPIIAAYNIFAAILRALGNSRSPLIAMTVAALINVGLDLLFVAVFGWGVAGAAVATVIAQGFSALYCLMVLRKIPDIRLEKQDFYRQPAMSLRLLKVATPLAIQNLIISVGGLTVQYVVNGFGFLFVAGFTASNKLYGVLEIAAVSYGYAITTYVGQNLGAKKYQRIRKGVHSGTYMALLTSVVISGVMVLFGRNILSLFVSGEPEQIRQVLDIAYKYLFIMAIFLWVLYLLYVYRSAIQGLGNTLIPLASGIAEFVMRVSVALLLPKLISELSEDRLVLLSTHIVSDVEYVANEIILMKEGKFFYTGTSDEIILSMDMFVWNCIIPKSELNNYMKKYLIGNVRTVSDGVELRVLSKMPPTGNAVQVEATLEDAFLLYFGEKAGDKDDVQI